MVDLTQTAANVGLADDSSATVIVKQAGEALTQGNAVYLASGKYYKTDADASVTTANAAGVVLTPAAADEYFVLCTAGGVDVGATLTVGETYVVSGTPGAIAPIADLATGDWVTHLGVASAANKLVLNISVTGSQVP